MDAYPVIVLVLLVWVGVQLALRQDLQRMAERSRAAPAGPIAELDALEERLEPIGRYGEREIYASVKFMGRRYRFEGVAPTAYRDRVQPPELFVEPGLVYRIDSQFRG